MPGRNANNILKLIYDKLPSLSGGKIPVVLASEADISTMQDDIALMKADLAAIRAILES